MRFSLKYKIYLNIFLYIGIISLGVMAQIQEKQLSNGLTVLVREISNQPFVSVFALVKTGAATEGEYLATGISHFLEHMLFKGTEKRKVLEIPKRVQELGGRINASTSQDYTIYTITIPTEYVREAIEILSDMLQNAIFDKDEIKKERTVVHQEMNLIKDDLDRQEYSFINQSIYYKHPYRYPVIGYKDLFNQINRKDIIKYYKKKYIPNNTIFSIVGSVRGSIVKEYVEQFTKDWKRGEYQVRNLPQENKQIYYKEKRKQYKGVYKRFAFVYKTIPLLHQDLYALDVLAMILGQGKSSRLYDELYTRKQMIHNITTYSYTPEDQGNFVIKGQTSKNNIKEIQKKIRKEINNIQRQSVTLLELEKSKKSILKQYIFNHQKTSDMAWSQSMDKSMTGDKDFSRKYVTGINKVTSDDIQRVAKEYLNKEQLTRIILDPEQEIKTKKRKYFTEEIEKIELSNGIRILLKQDNYRPIISTRIVMQGGLMYEQFKQKGISNLMINLWVKEIEGKTIENLLNEIEDNAISVRSFSGRSSMGIEIESLSTESDRNLDLLIDFLKKPTFPEKELEKIKKSVKRGFEQRREDIINYMHYYLKQNIFQKKHPYRYDTIGKQDHIDKINQKHIIKYYNKMAVSSNIVISIFGDFNKERVKKKLLLRLNNIEKKRIRSKIL